MSYDNTITYIQNDINTMQYFVFVSVKIKSFSIILISSQRKRRILLVSMYSKLQQTIIKHLIDWCLHKIYNFQVFHRSTYTYGTINWQKVLITRRQPTRKRTALSIESTGRLTTGGLPECSRSIRRKWYVYFEAVGKEKSIDQEMEQ